MTIQSQPFAKPDPRRWKAMAILCIANILIMMDTSIIGVALPAIQEELGYTQSSLQWVFNAYVIFSGGFLLLGGRLSDLFGHRRIFLLGFVVLTLSSLLGGLAWNEGSLNIARALQGFGSALIAPASLTIVMTLFSHDHKELGKAMGMWGAAAAGGVTAGVFLGGILTDLLSWRWTLLINVPIAILILLGSVKTLPSAIRRKGSIDFIGALFVTAAAVLVVYGIIQAESAGWSSPTTLWTLLIAIALLALFLVVQAYKKEPLVPLGIFSTPNLSVGNLFLVLLSSAWTALWFFLNLYLQQVLQYSALASGLALLPSTVLIMIIMIGVNGGILGKLGIKTKMVVGMLALAISLFLFSRLTPIDGKYLTHVLPASLLGAFGMALAYIPGMMLSVSRAKPEETGLASGLANMSYQIGSAVGLAAMVAVASATTASMAGAEQIVALNDGFHVAFLWSGILAIAGTLIALIFIRLPKNSES